MHQLSFELGYFLGRLKQAITTGWDYIMQYLQCSIKYE
jgi:hypothetical protein